MPKCGEHLLPDRLRADRLHARYGLDVLGSLMSFVVQFETAFGLEYPVDLDDRFHLGPLPRTVRLFFQVNYFLYNHLKCFA